MTLIDKLLEQNSGKCDACGLQLGRKVPAILNLLEEAPSKRKKLSSSLLVCNDGLNFLMDYSIRDQVLLISGRYGDFNCPKINRSNTVKFKNSARGKSKNNTKEASHQAFESATTHKAKKHNIPLTSDAIDPRISSNSFTSSKPPQFIPRTVLQDEEIDTPSEPDPGFNSSKLEAALKSHLLTTTQIIQILDQSDHLGISSELKSRLKEEYDRVIGEMRKKEGYFVDKDGVVVPVKIPKKLTHEFLYNPPKETKKSSQIKSYPWPYVRPQSQPLQPVKTNSGYFRCKHCTSLMFYTDLDHADCRHCGTKLIK
jgi:hypothetical protein